MNESIIIYYMKLLFHRPGHHKNQHAIQQMCASVGWECEFTTSDARLQHADYDIVVLNSVYIPPERIPHRAKIIYGPQHWVFPTGPLVGAPRDDLKDRACYNVLSVWVSALYYEVSGPLIVPKACLPFGIDISRFSPVEGGERSLECIVYIKRRDPRISSEVFRFLQERGVQHVVYRYGSYSESNYLRDLQRARYMIVIDAHESQGFAIQEAMSCDVPLLVINATTMYDEVNERGIPIYKHMRPKLLLATSVPYWSDKCGRCFTDISLLPDVFRDFKSDLDAGKFRPREFILETLSPEVCMRRIMEYFSMGLT